MSGEIMGALALLHRPDHVLLAGLGVSQMILQNSPLITSFLKSDDLQVLTELLGDAQCQNIMLCAFRCIVQLLRPGVHPELTQLLEGNRFLELLFDIIATSEDDETQKLAILLARSALRASESFTASAAKRGVHRTL